MCYFCSDKMKNTKFLPKLIVLNEFQLKHSCHILIYQRKVALRDSSHTKKSLWMKARGNWFMFANSSFRTVFRRLQVSTLEEKKKKSGDVFTRFTLTLRLSIAFRMKGGFLDSVELSLSLRFSWKWKQTLYFSWKKYKQCIHTLLARSEGSVRDYKQWCKQKYEVLWTTTADSCHPNLSAQHAIHLAQPDPATSLELCPFLEIDCMERETLSLGII